MSDAPADTATSTDSTTPEATDGTDAKPDTDWRAEADKWKALAQKHEQRAKGNAKSLADLEKAQRDAMTDQDRAIAEARDAAFAEGRAIGLGREVAALVRAAAVGRIADVDALLEGLDASRFVTDDGEADAKAVQAWVDKVAPAKPEGQQPLGAGIDLGQGSPNSTTPIGDDAGLENMLRDAVGLPKR